MFENPFGPGATIAGIVVNAMPRRERRRNDLHRYPQSSGE
jgi:nitrate/nitrite transport system ATP-binding protein